MARTGLTKWLLALAGVLLAAGAQADEIGLSVTPSEGGGGTVQIEVGPEHSGRLICLLGGGEIWFVLATADGVPPLVLDSDDTALHPGSEVSVLVSTTHAVRASCFGEAEGAGWFREVGSVHVDEVGPAWIRARDLRSMLTAMARAQANVPDRLTFGAFSLKSSRRLAEAKLRVGAAPREIQCTVAQTLDEAAGQAEFVLSWNLPERDEHAFLIIEFPVVPPVSPTVGPVKRRPYGSPIAVRRISGAGEASLRVPVAWLGDYPGAGPTGRQMTHPHLWFVHVARSIGTSVTRGAGDGFSELEFLPTALPDDRWYVSGAQRPTDFDQSLWPSLDGLLVPEGMERWDYYGTHIADVRATLQAPDGIPDR